MAWSLFGGLMPPADATEENKVKSRKNSGDSGIEVEDLFVVIPESLTFAETTDILN